MIQALSPDEWIQLKENMLTWVRHALYGPFDSEVYNLLKHLRDLVERKKVYEKNYTNE